MDVSKVFPYFSHVARDFNMFQKEGRDVVQGVLAGVRQFNRHLSKLRKHRVVVCHYEGGA